MDIIPLFTTIIFFDNISIEEVATSYNCYFSLLSSVVVIFIVRGLVCSKSTHTHHVELLLWGVRNM